MLAVRQAIPWSFIGLLAGLAALMLFAPAPAEPTAGAALLARFTLAELPAFGIMAATLVVILSYRLATALALDRVLVTATACAAFALALPRPFAFADPVAYLHRVGESGLLLAILAALAAAGAPYALRRAVRPAALASALGAFAVVGAALALFGLHLADYQPAAGRGQQRGTRGVRAAGVGDVELFELLALELAQPRRERDAVVGELCAQ